MVKMPWTGHTHYFDYPDAQPPSVRSAQLPPVTAPAPSANTYRKAGVPPQAQPSWFAKIGAFTFGPGGSK